MPPEKGYWDIVDKIISSPSFGKSETYANLLRYLVSSTLEGNVPKETTIASDIFGKSSFDPSQSTVVRVFVFNLRKKLAKYYDNEGAGEQLIITIPKGGYKVEFQERGPARTNPQRTKNLIIAAMGLLLLISLVFNLQNWKKEERIQEDSFVTAGKGPIWSDVLDSKYPFQLVLGDLFTFSAYVGVDTLTIRHPYINSTEEFERYRVRQPGLKHIIYSRPYSLLTTNTTEAVRSTSRFLYANDREFNIKFKSVLDANTLRESNFLVFGMLKTFGPLNSFFNHSRFKLASPEQINVLSSTGDTLEILTPSGNPDTYHVDYGIVAKFPGPNNNVILMAGGLWDTGASQSLRLLTDPDQLATLESELKKLLGSVPPYFEVLIEVTGINRTELKPRILYAQELDVKKDIWSSTY